MYRTKGHGDDRTLETNLQSRDVLSEASANEEEKDILNSYTVMVLWTLNCISTQKHNHPARPLNRVVARCFQSVLTERIIFSFQKLPED